jgi:RNA polymerase sigma-70 factor, ECF subfamily
MTKAIMGEDFARRAGPLRGELLAHCYRMLGSLHEAEDVVQETLLRAWKAYDRYDEERASMRTWLYRIATNASLNALAGRARRPLPSGLVGPSQDPEEPMVRALEQPWLQPFPGVPTALGADPAAAMQSRHSLRLALVAAMQYLPPRQRAVLILRDVLEFSAAETAKVLETTSAAVNSGLQRARARLDELSPGEEEIGDPADPDSRGLVDRYIAAFERADVAGLARLLADDVVLEMPPVLNWYVGGDAYSRFMARVFTMRGPHWRAREIVANGQPAIAAYALGPDGAYEAHSLQIFSVKGGLITRNVVYTDTGLFPAFGLPDVLETAKSQGAERG